MAGRPPKPTAIKKLEGNPGKRPLNGKEPKPPAGATCPTWLLPEAKKEWKRIAPILLRIGLLTKSDRVALAGYCQSYAKWRAAEEFVAQNGNSYPIKKFNKEGELVGVYYQQYPEVSIAIQCLKEVRAFCSMFGLDPSSRSKLEVAEQGEAGNFSDKIRSRFGE